MSFTRLEEASGQEYRQSHLIASGWLALRAHLYIGYHIMPNAPLALVLAAVFGGKAIYQMTGGPIQAAGGGYRSENPLLAALAGLAAVLESMMFALLRCFDLIIVRGRSALEFVRANRLNEHCAIITGAIDTYRFHPQRHESRDIDVVGASRLVPSKGVEHCIGVAAELTSIGVVVRLAMVGGGPLEEELRRLAVERGVSEHVEFMGQLHDVAPILQRSRLFLLLSPSEGMSIAMLEALAIGLPVVVTDVGELSDAFAWGDVGVLARDVDHARIAQLIATILKENETWNSMSQRARITIETHYSIRAISERCSGLMTELYR